MYIYTLSDPRSGEIRYVGKTMYQVRHRLQAHISQARREPGQNRRTSWIASLLTEGLEPMLNIVEATDTDGCAEERILIATLRAEGVRLVNGTDGGDGTTGPRSPEAVAKHRETLRTQGLSPALQEALAKGRGPWSDERKAAWSRTVKSRIARQKEMSA